MLTCGVSASFRSVTISMFWGTLWRLTASRVAVTVTSWANPMVRLTSMVTVCPAPITTSFRVSGMNPATSNVTL